MWVELTHDIADNTSRFFESLPRIKAKLAHGEQQAAMDRLQPVTHVGKRARGDRRQRIGEITFAQRGRKGGIDNPVIRTGHHLITHRKTPFFLSHCDAVAGHRHRK